MTGSVHFAGSLKSIESIGPVNRIGVLSDTHATSLDQLPSHFIALLKDVDLIIHAGDYTSMMFVDEIRSMGIPFCGVYGNVDGPAIREILRAEELLQLGSLKIGVTHPAEGGPPWETERIARNKFIDVDVIIYGHTHAVSNEVKDGVLNLNPGSARGRPPARYASMAILSIYPEPRAVIHKA
ncbi:MAG: metallophosphoesterase family protein [Thermoproteota archaeon]